VVADLFMQSLGLAAWPAALLLLAFGLAIAVGDTLRHRLVVTPMRSLTATLGVLALAAALSTPTPPAIWPLVTGMGGLSGDGFSGVIVAGLNALGLPGNSWVVSMALGLMFLVAALTALGHALGLRPADLTDGLDWIRGRGRTRPVTPTETARARPVRRAPPRPRPVDPEAPPAPEPAPAAARATGVSEPRVAPTKAARTARKDADVDQRTFDFVRPPGAFDLPSLATLAKPEKRVGAVDEAALKQNARLLEEVLQEFGVRGTIDQIRPGPVVTLYELVPAPGVKHGRVVALSDDIARSMSARACRISVVQGRNAIGIELPNAKRETVYLRDLLASGEYDKPAHLLPLALGETIGGEPYVADLARMPHLLIAGTTGSGKSVGVNAMILSILYRLSPDECRFIMIDPKMLELSVYDGIPHLLSPVVTDPKKAVVALKWTVREMEDRYRRMSKLGVRNIAGYNARAREAQEKGEHFERTVQTGFDDQGRPVYESEKIRPEPMPYLVVVMDEMADLMLVAGKDVEGAVQRLAQMARAAGIHLIMATQRPSVDVITGTIKANFPTRISFQVTSKIDSRTILGEQGGEQLLGQGDMLYMAGGGRITRLHGPFVTDREVEEVCAHLRAQGTPDYLDLITDEPDGDGGDGGDDAGGTGDDLYDRAVAVVTRDRKASTSYVQRRLQIGYNRAATLIERMEQEGVVSPANHAGKRDVLAGPPPL
jgi:S-DNA-T family DNA segregation ATPase FtsK/SpoIIIE